MFLPDYPRKVTDILLYNFYFYDIKVPITIEASSKDEARKHLGVQFNTLPAAYQSSWIIGESVVEPLVGVSKKEENGKIYVWIGKEKSPTGWTEEIT